jgi:hypothetical protein
LTSASGAFFRTPDGNAETVAAEMGTDFGWFAVNVGDGWQWPSWDKFRSRCAPGVEVIPWRRCLTIEHCLGLLDTADLFGCPRVILNVENEFETVLPPAKVATLIENDPYEGDVGISGVGWLPNDVDFTPLAIYPVLLQLFAQDMRRDPAELQQIQSDCVKHARDKGFVHCGVTFQTYGQAKPEWYGYWDGVRSYFTGDDIGQGGWPRWKP